MIASVLVQWKNSKLGENRLFLSESAVLAIALPFLLFPLRSPPATVAILALLLFTWLFSGYQNRANKFLSPFSLVIVAFGCWSLIGMLVTADPELTVEKSAGLLLGLATWRLIALYFKNGAAIKLLVGGYLLFGFVMVAIGFLAVDWLDKIPAISLIVNVFPQQVLSFTSIGSGTGIQPNQLAGTVLWLFPISFSVSWILLKRNPKQYLSTYISLVFSVVLVIILVLSQSRSAWLGGLSAIGVGLWLASLGLPHSHWYRPMRFILPCLAVICIVALFGVIGSTQLLDFWINPPSDTAIGNLGTLSFRKEVWTWAIQAVQDFSFTGTGLGSFRQVVHRLYPIAIPVTYDIAHAHNIFLQVALDFGLPGLIFYLGLLGIYFYIGLQAIYSSQTYRTLSIGLITAQFGFHVFGLTDAIAIGAKPSLLFWILIGLMTILSNVKQGDVEGVIN
jgi:putative inorganic carbon (HCO3(-)) transporter